MKIRSVGAELFDTDGRTDMKNLIFAFRNFVNAAYKRGISLKRIQVLSNVTLRSCLSGSWRLEATYCLHIQASGCLLSEWLVTSGSSALPPYSSVKLSVVWMVSDVSKQRIASIFKRQAVRLWAFFDVFNEPSRFIFHGHAAWTARPFLRKAWSN